MIQKAFFLIRCASKEKQPLALALRLAKHALNWDREHKADKFIQHHDLENRIIDIDIKQEEVELQQLPVAMECPRLKYEVLQDKNEFLRQLDVMFERRMLQNKSGLGEGEEFLEPRNEGLMLYIHDIYASAAELMHQLIRIRKTFRAT